MYKDPIVFSKSTRTAAEAAEALGCELGQIAKSIIFGVKNTERLVLIVASGVNRIDEMKISQYLDEKVEKVNAEIVRSKTGFVIGGVPPWGHKEKLLTFIDEDLEQYDKIWASSGKTNAVFETNFEELVRETGGQVIRVKPPSQTTV